MILTNHVALRANAPLLTYQVAGRFFFYIKLCQGNPPFHNNTMQPHSYAWLLDENTTAFTLACTRKCLLTAGKDYTTSTLPVVAQPEQTYLFVHLADVYAQPCCIHIWCIYDDNA